nr:MAG TPA: hypothetical protein [Caudoviricetes sp.]
MYQLINLLTATINKHFCERRIKNDQATFLYFLMLLFLTTTTL